MKTSSSSMLGFVLGICKASDFESFEAFRNWIKRGEVSDEYANYTRTTLYRREGLEVSTLYSTFKPGFRHATINGENREIPSLRIKSQCRESKNL